MLRKCVLLMMVFSLVGSHVSWAAEVNPSGVPPRASRARRIARCLNEIVYRAAVTGAGIVLAASAINGIYTAAVQDQPSSPLKKTVWPQRDVVFEGTMARVYMEDMLWTQFPGAQIVDKPQVFITAQASVVECSGEQKLERTYSERFWFRDNRIVPTHQASYLQNSYTVVMNIRLKDGTLRTLIRLLELRPGEVRAQEINSQGLFVGQSDAFHFDKPVQISKEKAVEALQVSELAKREMARDKEVPPRKWYYGAMNSYPEQPLANGKVRFVAWMGIDDENKGKRVIQLFYVTLDADGNVEVQSLDNELLGSIG